MLVLTLLCIGVGVLFVSVSATLPGIVFMVIGLMAEVLCLSMSRTHCISRVRTGRCG